MPAAELEVFSQCPRCRGTGATHDLVWQGRRYLLRCPWCLGAGLVRAGELAQNAEAWEALAIDAGLT